VVGRQRADLVQDDMGDLAVVGVPDGEDSDQVRQALGRRSRSLRLGRGDLDGEIEGRRRYLVQDVFLGREVEVQRGGAQPRLGCDVPGGGGVETALGERRGRRQQDAPGAGREVVLTEEPLKGIGRPGRVGGDRISGGRGGLGSRGGVRIRLRLRCCLVDHGLASLPLRTVSDSREFGSGRLDDPSVWS
jgi:hypothetical protein